MSLGGDKNIWTQCPLGHDVRQDRLLNHVMRHKCVATVKHVDRDHQLKSIREKKAEQMRRRREFFKEGDDTDEDIAVEKEKLYSDEKQSDWWADPPARPAAAAAAPINRFEDSTATVAPAMARPAEHRGFGAGYGVGTNGTEAITNKNQWEPELPGKPTPLPTPPVAVRPAWHAVVQRQTIEFYEGYCGLCPGGEDLAEPVSFIMHPCHHSCCAKCFYRSKSGCPACTHPVDDYSTVHEIFGKDATSGL